MRLESVIYADIGHGNKRYARPAKPAEIKAGHPQCGTCGWCKQSRPLDQAWYCTNPSSFAIDQVVERSVDYCRHHNQKDGHE